MRRAVAQSEAEPTRRRRKATVSEDDESSGTEGKRTHEESSGMERNRARHRMKQSPRASGGKVCECPLLQSKGAHPSGGKYVGAHSSKGRAGEAFAMLLVRDTSSLVGRDSSKLSCE
eukprot:scaffold49662_cov19-Tisochrysis_lutea.AAC.1